MKIALAVLVVAILALVWRLNSITAALTQQQQTLSQQQQQIQTLTTALADKSKQEGLALQEKCAVQAEKVFRDLGYKFNNSSQSLDSNILQSHFNPRLNKCFMTLEANAYTSGQLGQQRFLLDAYEQREYGEYFWVSDKVKKYWEVKPVMCKEIPVAGDEQFCHSEDEYKAIVKRYME
jgi:hypothetical protein